MLEAKLSFMLSLIIRDKAFRDLVAALPHHSYFCWQLDRGLGISLLLVNRAIPPYITTTQRMTMRTLLRISLVLVMPQAVQAFVSFQPGRALVSQHWWTATSKTTTTGTMRSSLWNQQSHNDSNDHNHDTLNHFRDSMASDPDRQRRRQLLLSLLASASAMPLVAEAQTPTTTGGTNRQPNHKQQSPTLIIAPPLDDRLYRTIILPNNNLRVVLCSDPSTNEAAVAMDVHVGATSDPDTIPGLAHFCEHMLFLGTKPVRVGSLQ